MTLVSCIMPTANRRRFVPAAIEMFLAQDYPQKELVILDDGEDRVADLVPPRPELRYLRSERRRPIGAKRNEACTAARGDIILHWDDDDWYAPNRIRYQVEGLLTAQADLCGIDHVLFVDPGAGRAWEYVYPDGAAPWVYGATLCYRRAFWHAHPFAEINIGEDTRFVGTAAGARIHALADNRFYVGLMHERNTSPKRVRDARWQPRAFASVRALTGIAWPPEHAALAAPPASIAPAPEALVCAASGIGDILRMTPLIRVLSELGYVVDVLLAPDCAEASELLRGAPEIRGLFRTADTTNRRVAQPVPELADRHYALATFTHWSAPLARQVKADRQLCFDRAEWLVQGDIACIERIARGLGWAQPLPPPFAMSSQRDFGLPPGTVALHPGCKPDWPWKKWHGFDALAHRFASVAVVGTAADLDNARTYFAKPFRWPAHVQNYAGRLCLADTAALIRQSAALVSNDSGLMHLGVALGVPTFGVFGITSPGREAIPSRHMVAISKGLDCEPACRRLAWGRRDCEHHLECLRTLTPDEVADRVLDTLPNLRALQAPAVSAEPQPDAIRVAYYGAVFDASGYGEAARATIGALHEAGIRIAVVDTGARPPQVHDPLVGSLLGADPDADFHLFHGIPPFWAQRAYRLRNVIAMTVWETDAMPFAWRNPLTHAVDVWLPSRFNVEVFARGLGREPFCLPHPLPTRGTPGDGLAYLTRRGILPDDFVFYACFEWQDRKNPDGLIEAFVRAFPGNGEEVLLIKSNPGAVETAQRVLRETRGRLGAEGRVLLCCESWSDAEIAALHARGDCYVSLHKGEGWGYPLFEAAAAGKPVVATAGSGPLDYLQPEHHWLVRAKLAPVRQRYMYYNPSMKWFEPDLAHAVEGLRWVRANRAAACAAGGRAALRLRTDYAPARIGEAAKRRLMELLAQSRPAHATVLLRKERRRLAPAPPIAGDWYDADYFENGVKSNWQGGYTWPLFRGVFTDTAAYLAELFPEARSFLDVGCAKGFLVRALRERGLEAWGFDHSRWAIDRAEEAARPYLQLADIETVSFDRQFDVVLALSIFESLTEAQIDRLLPRARDWAAQVLFAVIAEPAETADRDAPGDLSHITLRERIWWLDRLRAAGWRQDALHRAFERTAQAHPMPKRMGWSVYVLAPGHQEDMPVSKCVPVTTAWAADVMRHGHKC
jgi:glycosyltransferase involved in cell wall biosynthesis/SAM-dependent methyltransferase